MATTSPKNKLLYGLTVMLLAIGLGAQSAKAVTYNLKARTVNKIINGQAIQFWSFQTTVPGPKLTVPPNDSTLIVNLTNTLPVPISLVIPGLPQALVPVKTVDGSGRERIQSFDKIVPAQVNGIASTVTYQWDNVRPGSYLYHSGYDPQVQVQMGLYGAVEKLVSNNVPYTGITVNNAGLLLYSELDTAFHIAMKNYLAGNGPMPSASSIQPEKFLINGNPSPNTGPDMNSSPAVGQKILLRFLNAGNRTVLPTLRSGYMSVVAEDGFAYPYPKTQYLVDLPAGRGKDAIVVATSRSTRIIAPMADGAVADDTVDMGIYNANFPGATSGQSSTSESASLVRITNIEDNAGGGSASSSMCFLVILTDLSR